MTRDLHLEWCSHEAAKYAVEHWHYSRRMPKSKLAKIGVWEHGVFIGVVMFGVGATPELCKPYGLTNVQVAELVRVALNRHDVSVSRILSVSLRILKRSMPGLRLIVSFADSAQGHHGGIYQASGWIFTGESVGRYIVTNGKIEHPRTLGSRYGVGGQSIPWLRKNVDPGASQIVASPKYRYLFPLDEQMRSLVGRLAKPYPKRVRSAEIGTGVPTPGGGEIPTRTLQS